MPLRPIALSLALALSAATAVPAQIVVEPFAPDAEVAQFGGPWKRYQTHILKLAANRYAVLFRPGFIDRKGAIRAIQPLCAAKGKVAQGLGIMAPVELVFEDGVPSVQQGYQVACN